MNTIMKVAVTANQVAPANKAQTGRPAKRPASAILR